MTNTKDIITFFVGVVISIVVGGSVLVGMYGNGVVQPTVGSGGMPNTPNFAVGSSTTFTLTTTSQRLFATTTSGNGRRVAALVQPINCTIATASIFLNVEGSDAVATASNGIAVVASTTQAFGVFPNAPLISTNAIQAIAGAGTCTVLATEWITQ